MSPTSRRRRTGARARHPLHLAGLVDVTGKAFQEDLAGISAACGTCRSHARK
jgi:hypothetical protein